MKKFFVLACIIVLTMGLMLVSCQKKEEAVAPAVTQEQTEEAAQPAEAGGYGEEKPAAGGYGEEKAEEAKQ